MTGSGERGCASVGLAGAWQDVVVEGMVEPSQRQKTLGKAGGFSPPMLTPNRLRVMVGWWQSSARVEMRAAPVGVVSSPTLARKGRSGATGVKGGGKVGHVGDSIVGLRPVVVQDKCPPKRSAEMSPVYSGIVSDVDAGRVADDRRIGGLSTLMYRLTVSLWRLNSLAILRMDMPSSLAFCTASHRAWCRNVDLLGEVVTVMETTSASSMTEP